MASKRLPKLKQQMMKLQVPEDAEDETGGKLMTDSHLFEKLFAQLFLGAVELEDMAEDGMPDLSVTSLQIT